MQNQARRSLARLIVIVVPFCAISFLAGRLSTRPGPTLPLAGAPSAPGLSSVPDSTPTPPAVPTILAPPENHTATKRWDESRWQDLLARPSTPDRNQALAALLEALAAIDPQHALSLAQAEHNLKLRETLLHASLRGWGRAAPEDAANWALALTDDTSRNEAIAAVFAGAVARPDEAARVAKKLCAGNPGEATGYGHSLIDAFCDAGNFSAAIQLAGAGEGEAQRSIWTAEAYSRWALLQPEQAAQAAAALPDPAARLEALHGIVGGWAEADPAGLTHFVAELPPGSDRASLLGQALQSWVRLDPETAAEWINNREASPDYDEGVAAVATVEFVKTDRALGWAETIADRKLRSETVATVLHGWVLENLPAAKQYFAATTNLTPEDRQRISDIIATAEQATP